MHLLRCTIPNLKSALHPIAGFCHHVGHVGQNLRWDAMSTLPPRGHGLFSVAITNWSCRAYDIQVYCHVCSVLRPLLVGYPGL